MRKYSPVGGIELHANECANALDILQLVRQEGFALIRDLSHSKEQFIELVTTLGTPVIPPYLDEVSPGSGVALLDHTVSPAAFQRTRQVIFASGWHSDWTFLPQPPAVSILYCLEAPEAGGDTLLCDTVPSLEIFSVRFMAFIRGLSARHHSAASYSAVSTYATKEVVGAVPRRSMDVFSTVHPLLPRSPLTGLECVLVSPAYVTGIEELSDFEGSTILSLIRDEILWDENVSRIRWQPGSLLVWDNYRYLHRALNEGILGRRTMLRANVIAQPQ